MAKKKSLEKATDIKKINTVKEIREFVKANPQRANEVLQKLIDLLNKSYSDSLGIEDKVTELIVKCYTLLNRESEAKYIKNASYENNHTIISRCIHNFMCDNRCFPSIAGIIKETGLSRQTVYNHINNGFSDKLNKVVKGKIEYMIPKALEKLYLIGIEDNNAVALKYFLELSGISKNQNSSVDTNNYIQINNINLSKEEFNQLSEHTIIEIEQIISKEIGIKKPKFS